jgi:hypothetical protein
MLADGSYQRVVRAPDEPPLRAQIKLLQDAMSPESDQETPE